MLDVFLEDEEVECYNSQSNPTVYWEKKRYLWPDLYTVAVGYLAFPPTSVYSERVFSTAGAIVTDRRNRLTSKNVATLSFIRMNRAWIPNILPARVANSFSSAAESALGKVTLKTNALAAGGGCTPRCRQQQPQWPGGVFSLVRYVTLGA